MNSLLKAGSDAQAADSVSSSASSVACTRTPDAACCCRRGAHHYMQRPDIIASRICSFSWIVVPVSRLRI